jgi:predicted Zn-dependent protease
VREAGLRLQLEAELQQARQQLSRGDIQEAQRALEQLAANDPQWIAPRPLLAETYYRAGRLAEARSQLDWLAEHAVEHPRLSLIAGAIALSRREYAAALEELEYACYVEPTLPSIHRLLGMALVRLGEWNRAEDSFRNAISQNSDDAVAYDSLAAIRIRRGRFEEAANLALEAVERDIQLFAAHYHLGIALMNIGRGKEAITALETAAKMDPNRAAPYYWLSRIAAEQLGDSVQASRYRDAGRNVVRRQRKRRAMQHGEAIADE